MTLTLRAIWLVLLWYALPTVTPGIPGSVRPRGVVEAQESAKVWVNASSGVYHCPGTRYYGNTKSGSFMFEVDARAAGNRPAYGKACGSGPTASAAVTPQPLTTATPTPGAAGTKVWVNTRSGVYHCPGTRYYGNTKAGKFMSEHEARAAGHHAAYGRSCS